MIDFTRFVLKNGLRVLVHEDDSTPVAVVNVLYNVGAKDEDAAKTGFAHLFEHLMFGGSIHIPDYDEPLQLAGGENNAYTTNDYTNYYCQIPAENIETAFWLESDRMLSLAFSKKSLEVQKKVVCEEFKEHYINKPYGDVWQLLREMAYTVHPYKWQTIGKELAHVEQAAMPDVVAFFKKFYTPANAILVVAGNVQTQHVKTLAEKWFEPIAGGEKYLRALPAEPIQLAHKEQKVYRDVPVDALFKVWHIAERLNRGYYIADLITEMLGGSISSRLHESLVKTKQLCSSVACYHLGTVDKGLLTIEARLLKNVTMEQTEKAIEEEIQKFIVEFEEKELNKVKNKTESLIHFEDMSIMNRANSLAFYELLGDADLINKELDNYFSITHKEVQDYAREIFREENSCTLKYYSQQLHKNEWTEK